jgi:hypothetical protein
VLVEKARYTTEVVEDNIQLARKIAQGDYQIVEEVAPETALVPIAGTPQALAPEPTELPQHTATRTKIAWIRAANALKRREQALTGQPSGQ